MQFTKQVVKTHTAVITPRVLVRSHTCMRTHQPKFRETFPTVDLGNSLRPGLLKRKRFFHEMHSRTSLLVRFDDFAKHCSAYHGNANNDTAPAQNMMLQRSGTNAARNPTLPYVHPKSHPVSIEQPRMSRWLQSLGRSFRVDF